MLRAVYGQPSKYEHLDSFYTNRNEILRVVDQKDSLRGKERLEFSRENASVLRLAGALKSAEKQLRSIRKAKRSAEKYMSEERFEEYEEQMVEREYKVYRRFNARFTKETAED